MGSARNLSSLRRTLLTEEDPLLLLSPHTTHNLLRCTDLPHRATVLTQMCRTGQKKIQKNGGTTFIKPILSSTFMLSRVCGPHSVRKGTFFLNITFNTKRSNCPSSYTECIQGNFEKGPSFQGKVPKYQKEKYSKKFLLSSSSNKGETCPC